MTIERVEARLESLYLEAIAELADTFPENPNWRLRCRNAADVSQARLIVMLIRTGFWNPADSFVKDVA